MIEKHCKTIELYDLFNRSYTKTSKAKNKIATTIIKIIISLKTRQEILIDCNYKD